PGQDKIEEAARLVYKLLNESSKEELKISNNYKAAQKQKAAQRKAKAEYVEAATGLSQIILGPIAGLLGKKRLLIVSDGALQYVPFASLPVPGNSDSQFLPLLAEHEIISLPSASALLALKNKISNRKPVEKTVLAIADPVFNETDERI